MELATEDVERRGREVSLNGIKNTLVNQEGISMMNFEELQARIRDMRKQTLAHQRTAMTEGSRAAVLVQNAYEYLADADPATAEAKGGQVLRDFQQLADELDAVLDRLKSVHGRVRQASIDAQEAKVRRDHQARKLKV